MIYILHSTDNIIGDTTTWQRWLKGGYEPLFFPPLIYNMTWYFHTKLKARCKFVIDHYPNNEIIDVLRLRLDMISPCNFASWVLPANSRKDAN